MTRRPWTDAERETVLRLFPDHSADEIARIINRSTRSVHQATRAAGLKKSPEWIAQRARERALQPDHGGRKTQFTKGFKPWNAGTAGQGVMKPNSGNFKKGHRPQTWRPIGSNRVSKEGYLQRKTADTGVTRRDYVPVHHLVWRMHGRIVPRGHALTFIDGNPANLDINNLRLLTRAELMARNSVHRHGPEIAQLSQLKGAIRRQINNRSTGGNHV